MATPAKKSIILSPRQREGMQLCRQKRFVLFSGPRIGGKTVCSLHCVCDHARKTDRGNIAIVSISQSVGLDSGVWRKLTKEIIPQWIDDGLLEWKKEPYTEGVSKRPKCSVVNVHGNVTELQLDSLKFEQEVEERFKSREFSAMYVPELSHFTNRETFDMWTECLRASHLKDSDFLFLADTNPADDGMDSWIYWLWFTLPAIEYEEYCEISHGKGWPILSEKSFYDYRKQFGSLIFTPDHNPFLSESRKELLRANLSSNPDKYRRYWLGDWIKANEGALFFSVFKRGYHVRGEITAPNTPDPEIMVPETTTMTLRTGWDPGQGVNSAFVIIERIEGRVVLPSGKTVVKSLFKVLDEVVITGQDHLLPEFAASCLERMEYWEDRCGKPFEWIHWSDRSVFDARETKQNLFHHQIIYDATQGSVILKAADRGPGTILQRINLFRRLLFEDRIFFNNDLCPRAIEMCVAMRAGRSRHTPIESGSKHKHVFDAITYCIASEIYDELEESVFERVRTSRDERNARENSIVTVAL